MRRLKALVEKVPYGVGNWLARVPFSWRLGGEYARMRQECRCVEAADDADKESYAIEHFRRIFEFARESFPCYRKLYEESDVLGLKIKTFSDIQKVPIIDKAWARTHFQEFNGAYRLNTGGSSGEPTAFWADKQCWAREWAHMHTIWEMLGYDYRDLKLAIRGRNLGAKPFLYNPVHNEYIINTYLPVKKYAPQLRRLFSRRKVCWFHGYPSAIYQFILECESAFGEDGAKKLLDNVKGLLLSSEFPMAFMTAKFAEYGLKWISWYGHSEMAILAYDETCKNSYHPFVTYGLAEVEDGHLLGTSYHNYDMPLIRYDTGDGVEVKLATSGGLCKEFAIKEGREGDFIEDKDGRRIPLTALIFGRHHRAFDVADYIQIEQKERGKAILYVCGQKCESETPRDLFDLSNVKVDFTIEFLDLPIRTTAGKLKLRV